MTRLVVLAFVALLSTNALAQEDRFKEGVHYTLIAEATKPNNEDKVTVYEIFGYLCPHCFSFQPYVTAWHDKLPDSVEFVRVPAIFSAAWEPLGRAYLTAEMLGVADKGHDDLYKAIHQERKQIRSIEDAANFFANYGVERDTFLSTASSFAVDAKVRQYQALVRKWGVRGTPSMVINGKYLISISQTVPQPVMLEVADYLIAKEAAAK